MSTTTQENHKLEKSRRVSRVLVMLEYATPGVPGDVFDLTALTEELAQHKDLRFKEAEIVLHVERGRDCEAAAMDAMKTEASWRVNLDYNFAVRAGWLDDAINAAMPETSATLALRERLKRLNKAAEKLADQIREQKLRDAAAVRSQYPIARVNPGALTAALEVKEIAN